MTDSILTDKAPYKNKLSYLELLSPSPVYVPQIGSIISPRLKDIASIGMNIYQKYLNILLIDLKSYFSMLEQEIPFELLPDAQKVQINPFELLTINEESVLLLQNILNFFIEEEVSYSLNNRCFLIQKNNELIGVINKENYPIVSNLICQRNCIKPNSGEDLSKVQSKKALEIIKKLQKGRSKKHKEVKPDQDMELGNIISAVANKSPALNILNIWDLTVYQLWDCFSRLSNNNIYNIQSMSVAAWGDKDKHFDASAWFKRINTDN